MSWVTGLFTTTPKFAPEPSHDSTSFSVVQGYAVEEVNSHGVAQASQTTTNLEEAEEIRRPYWQVWLNALTEARLKKMTRR